MYYLNSNRIEKKQNYGFTSIIFLVLSVFILFLGILGIIENKSPQDLASFATLSFSFMNYIEYHLMIFLGALGFIFTIWFNQKKDFTEFG